MLFIWLIADGILSQRRFLVFHSQRIAMQADHRRMASQGLFPIQLPPLKMGIPQPISSAQKAHGIKNPVQLLRRVQFASLLTEHFRRTETVVIALAVRPVWLHVVIGHKVLMSLFLNYSYTY